MTGVAQRISAIAVAIALGLGLLTASRLDSAFAQNESEPEATPIEEPQAEPTEFTPVTAGEAERGAPVATPEATTLPAIEETPAQSPTPAELATPAEKPPSNPTSMETPASAPSPSGSTTISRERSHTRRRKTNASMSPVPEAVSTPNPPKAGKAGLSFPRTRPSPG